MTSAESDKRVIWNQPVCQKNTLIGCKVGIRLTFTGISFQGSAPKGAITAASGHVFDTLVFVSQPLVLSGTILQLGSDLTSTSCPSASSTRRPKIKPANDDEL